MWPFKLLTRARAPGPAVEARAAGYTADVLVAREAYISGRAGLGELTATAQSCVSLWEAGLGLADVDGTTLLDRRALMLMARGLALRGEALFLVRDEGLVPAHAWDVGTRDGRPRAYRVSVAEAGGGRTETVLAGEVIHARIGVDAAMPWVGVPPLRRAQLTAGLLHAVETALAEVYDTAPLGSQIVPYPEAPEADLAAIGRSFRGRRGGVMVRESVNVASAGGPTPLQDWKPHDLTPDLRGAMTAESLEAARGAVALAFGVLPALASPSAAGPLVREAQRHLAQWCLQPIAALVAEEATAKLGTPVRIDVMRPIQAFDVGGRARALATIVDALAAAKDADVDPAVAMKLVDWEGA